MTVQRSIRLGLGSRFLYVGATLLLQEFSEWYRAVEGRKEKDESVFNFSEPSRALFEGVDVADFVSISKLIWLSGLLRCFSELDPILFQIYLHPSPEGLLSSNYVAIVDVDVADRILSESITCGFA